VAFQTVRGMKDILPGEVGQWQLVEALARDFFPRFGYQEVRLPLLEKTELFVRGIGQTTDVVEKEMYTLTDVSGDSLSLRPEATAQICRAFVEHNIHKQEPVWKVFTIGPMFRHERPQKGRYRQFHQINCEVIGPGEGEADAELIAMLIGFLEQCRTGRLAIRINSLGCPRCRPAYRAKLIDFLKDRRGELCPDCRRRLEANPLRVLDCKQPGCAEIVAQAPASADNLCPECASSFVLVRERLALLEIEAVLDHRLVRGLDYYVGTTFEVVSDKLGGQDAVAGGGRYDGLIQALGGPDVPGTGFAIGLERLLLLAEMEGRDQRPAVFIGVVGGERAREFGVEVAHKLRLTGQARVLMDLAPRSLKAQLRAADKVGALGFFFTGDEELASGRAVLRNLRSGEEVSVSTQTAAASAADISAALNGPWGQGVAPGPREDGEGKGDR